MKVRIPGWARGEASPGGLYRFADASKEQAKLAVNGVTVPIEIVDGYATVDRVWKRGDTIALDLPMPVRRVVAANEVAADRGRVALQRGPIVYCAEWPDNPGGHVRNLVVASDAKLSTEFRPSLLNGVEVVTGKATALAEGKDGVVVTPESFTAIPYYAWANRGPGEMEVWLASSPAAARLTPRPTLASTSTVTASFGERPETVHDLEMPTSSHDRAGYFHWYPHKGTTEWIEYALAAPTTVSSTEVYWYDDTDSGECRAPASWRLLYKADDGEWKEVEGASGYGVALDQFNRVAFRPVKTSALRIEVRLRDGWSAGVQEWAVGAR